MKKLYTIFFLFIGLGSINGQTEYVQGYRAYQPIPDALNKSFHWGLGLKLSSTLVKQNQSEFAISLVSAIGLTMGKAEFDANTNFLFPSYHVELCFLRGGQGAPLGLPTYNQWSVEIRNAILLTYALDSRPAPVARPIPIMVYNGARVLDDPYYRSLRLGTVYIRNLTYHRNQRMGNLGFGWNNVSFDYHNDGSFIHGDIFLGDQYDRWYTGSGEISVYASKSGLTFNRLSLGFSRFTGFHPYSYEIANQLGLYYVPYPKFSEQLKNQGRWTLGGDFANGMRMEIMMLDDPFIEVQNIIHWLSGTMPLHPSALKRRYGYTVAYMNRYEEKK